METAPHLIRRPAGFTGDIRDLPTPAELAAEARTAEGETAAGFVVTADENAEAF